MSTGRFTLGPNPDDICVWCVPCPVCGSEKDDGCYSASAKDKKSSSDLPKPHMLRVERAYQKRDDRRSVQGPLL